MRTFLVIDGHNFIYRSLFGMPKPSKGKYLEKKQDRAFFNKQLIVQTMALLHGWKTVADGMVFVWDFGTWRKELATREYAGVIDYKGNRKDTEQKVDKVRFGECIAEFKKWLDLCRIAQCELPGAEGDDWICSLARRFNGMGDSVIIYSTDHDLHQLITDGVMELAPAGERNFTLFATESDCGRLTEKEGGDIIERMLGGGSMKIDALKLLLNELRVANRLKIEPVNAQGALFEKILIGDISDNIPSVCTFAKTTKRFGGGAQTIYGLTPMMSRVVLERFDDKTGISEINTSCYFNDELKSVLCECILEVAKQKLKDTKTQTCYGGTLDDVKRNFDRNMKFVMLGCEEVLPPQIFEGLARRTDEIVADGAYLNWSAIDNWWVEHAPEYSKMDVNAMRKILTKEERETDWSFLKKDGEQTPDDTETNGELPVNEEDSLGIVINGKLF